MKSILTFTMVMVLACGAAADEIFVPDNQPGTGSTNVIPFKGSFMKTDCRYQALYKASYFNGNSFTIKDIAFASTYTGQLDTTRMQIRISHFTGSALSPTMDLNIPAPVTVLDASPHVYSAAVANSWCPIGLTCSFVYNGTDNLVIDIRYTGGKNTGSHGGFRYTKGAIPRNWAYGNFNAVTQSGSDTSAGLKTRFTVEPISITASGTPKPGGTVLLDLVAPGDGTLTYQVGSSFGTGPIGIDCRQLALSFDALLIITVNGQLPTVFMNFGGNLSTAGKAQASVAIPSIPALVGISFYSAFTTIKVGEPSNIKSISPSTMVTITS